MQAERSTTGSGGRPIDAAALRRTAARLLTRAEVPWLHQEAARRMSERLPLIRLQPKTVLDWSGPLGASSALLRKAYPDARHCLALPEGAVAAATPPPTVRTPWWDWRRPSARAIDAVPEEAVAAAAADLVWANMMLHGRADPQAQFARWHRATAVGGFLMFSTLGPGSLPELQRLFRKHGWGEPFAPFVDMHDLGDMLVHAGYADPVMDQELLTLTWPSADALLNELRGLGGNVSLRRHFGLRTPRWRQRLLAALLEQAEGGRPSLTFELVYGHAFCAAPKLRVQAQTAVSLDDMRTMIRTSKR